MSTTKKRNKKLVIILVITIVAITTLIVTLLALFLPRKLTLVASELSGLSADNISSIEIEKGSCCGPVEGDTVVFTMDEKDFINDFILLVNETVLIPELSLMTGGSYIKIAINTIEGEKINLDIFQGKVNGTYFQIENQWDLIYDLEH